MFLAKTVETGDKNCDDFYCMQMNLVMRMWFIFADDWNNAQCLSRFSAMAKLFLHARNHTNDLFQQNRLHFLLTIASR